MEDLENLSNADLREKCIQYGLPNIPITDSSRNVLIRKLRVSMGGTNATPQKKGNRRETIHVLKKPAKEVVGDSRSPAHGSVRRTIVGTSKLEEKKPSKKFSNEADAAKNDNRSVREREVHADRKSREKDSPIVVIESDAEEDDVLITAAEKVEQLYNGKNARDSGHSRNSRSVSLSKTDTIITSCTQAAETLLPTISEKATSSKADYIGGGPSISSSKSVFDKYAKVLGSDVPKLMPEMGPRMSHIEPTYMRHNVNSPYTGYGINRKSTDSPTYSNIISNKSYVNKYDDTQNELPYETPYLSNFARNLERLKVGYVGSQTGQGSTNLKSKAYYQEGRDYNMREFPSAKDSVRESLRRWLMAMDRKYNLRTYFMFVVVFLVLVFCYVLIFQ